MFRKIFRFVSLGTLSVLVLLGARSAFGQNADQNTAGPTKNDFRLRVIEPREGATIVGSTVRVTVANAMAQPTQEKATTSDMPNPTYRIYLGNTLMGELKRDQNVFTMENVPAGSQKLVVQALNPSGEVIARQEIGFTTVKASAAVASEPKPAVPAAAATGTTETTATATHPPPVPEAAPAPADTYATTSKPAALPKTASYAPGAALAGFGLLLAGLLVSRKRTR